MPKEERRGSYCRFLCFRRWTPRPYKPPPANVAAAMKTNFRHGGSAHKEASQPRASRYRVVPEPPRASRASGGDDAYARARRLPCYAEYVNGVEAAATLSRRAPLTLDASLRSKRNAASLAISARGSALSASKWTK